MTLQPGRIRNLSPIKLAQLAQFVQAEGPDAEIIATALVQGSAGVARPHSQLPTAATLTEAITNIEPQSNMQGSDQLVVTILDPEWKLLDSGFLNADEHGLLNRIELQYPNSGYPTLDDGHEFHWTLNQVQVQGNHMIQLVFVNSFVYALQQKRGPVRGNRATETRAQFLRGLAKSVGLEFYSYELNAKQPITTTKRAKTALLTRKAKKGQGLTGPISYTFWDGSAVSLTQAEIDNAQIVCDTIASQRAPDRAAWACLCACIVEPGGGGGFDNPVTPGDHGSVGILQVTPTTAAGLNFSALEISAVVTHFLLAGYASKARGIGAIGLARQYPNLTPGQIAQYCQGSGFPDRYERVLPAAKMIWSKYGALTGSGSGGVVNTPPSPQVTMFDTDGGPSSLSGQNVQAFAAYINDGAGNNNYTAFQAAYPTAYSLRITFDPSGGTIADCLDVEGNPNGPANLRPQPSDAGPWVKKMLKAGVWRPCVYGNGTNMAAIQASLQTAGLQRSQYRLWFAHYDGVATVPAAYDAKQYASPGAGLPAGTQYDKSICNPGFFSGGGSSVSGAQGAYYFTVGTPSNPHETYWDAMNRLAREVNWALIFDGNRCYYDSEPALAKQAPSAVIERGEEGLMDWHFDWDNRGVASQFTLTLQCDPFEFHAGETFELRGFGPASSGSSNGAKKPGSWLIATIDRKRHEIIGTFTLKQPSLPKKEPPNPAPKRVNLGGLPNLPNGTTNPAPGATWGRLDMGFDGNYDMTRGAVAPFSGTIHGIGIGGWPGDGQYFVVVNDDVSGPEYTRAMYFAEGATPLFGNGAHVKAGQKIGQPVSRGGTGRPGNFEIGPASPVTYDCLAKGYGLGSAAARQMVMAFYNWMRSLGAGQSTDTRKAGSP